MINFACIVRHRHVIVNARHHIALRSASRGHKRHGQQRTDDTNDGNYVDESIIVMGIKKI